MKQVLNKESIQLILKRLEENGYQTFITGGAVRDVMLNKIPHDVDVLTNASLEEVCGLFPDRPVKKVGQSFPICIVDGIEVSTARDGFKEENFPESDLAKRDFTLNAMAYDPVEKRILDPFNGRKDLEKRVIRFTKDPEQRIKEDPVRMIRACRFAAAIDGTLSVASLDTIIANARLIHEVAKERIRHEIMRAMPLKTPSVFFIALKKAGLLDKIFPSLDRCYGLDGGPFHNETVFEHCMIVGDALSPKMPVLRLAGFLHDAGKADAAVVKEGELTFAGHEKQIDAVMEDLITLRFSTKDIDYIKALVLSHMRPLTPDTTPKAARRLLAMLDERGISYRDFMRMRIADKKGNRAKTPYTFSDIRVRLEKLYDVFKEKSPLGINSLNITGEQIMNELRIEPGPEVGEIKQMLFERVLDHPELNNPQDLISLCREFKTKK